MQKILRPILFVLNYKKFTQFTKIVSFPEEFSEIAQSTLQCCFFSEYCHSNDSSITPQIIKKMKRKHLLCKIHELITVHKYGELFLTQIYILVHKNECALNRHNDSVSTIVVESDEAHWVRAWEISNIRYHNKWHCYIHNSAICQLKHWKHWLHVALWIATTTHHPMKFWSWSNFGWPVSYSNTHKKPLKMIVK